jgi:hypothetical protein
MTEQWYPSQMDLDELVHMAVVPRAVLWAPVVRDVGQAELDAAGGELERDDGLAAGVLLAERGRSALVAEPPHTAERPEVVVERAVLLDEEDDVLDVLERALI